MPLALPKFPTPRVKSPAPKPRPSKPPSTTSTRPSRRAQSLEAERRYGRGDSPSRRRPSTSRTRHRSPSRDYDRDRRSDRRHRRGSISSPSPDRRGSSRRDYDDDRRGRRASLAVDRDGRAPRSRTSDGRPDLPPVKPGVAAGGFNDEGRHDPRRANRRSSTPDKYKPKDQQGRPTARRDDSPPPRPKPEAATKPSPAATPAAAPSATTSPAPAAAPKLPSIPTIPTTPAAAIQAVAAAAPQGSSMGKLFGNMPAAMATYAGVKELSKHADTAKEWATWLEDLHETPEEIDSLSNKASTARDTIKQVEQTLKTRPDLLEGEDGERLREQIEDAVKSTNKALGKMTTLLAEITKKGAKNGDVINGLQDFWRSYRYKDEFEGKIKAADDALQKELTLLGNLMFNIHSRALLKPNPAVATPNDKAEAADDKKPTAAKLNEAGAKKAAAAKPAEEEAKTSVPAVVGPPSTDTVSAATSVAPKVADAPKTEPAPVVVPPPTIPVEAERKASTPTIVEPHAEQSISPWTIPKTETGKAATTAAAATAAVAASAALPPLDIRGPPHSPPPRSPSAIADEEATVGAPPAMSPSATGARRTDNGKASQEPRRSSKYDKEAPYKSDSAGERSRRESISSDGEAQDVLLDAAWDGDVDAVARALRNAPVNGCDLHGQTPLHLAAERDKLAVAMLLLDRGADVHARSDGGRTPLHLAARSASSSTVETLLERGGSDPNARTAKGRTALHYAASAARDGDEERREVLRILRDWGADPTVEDRDGETARDVAQKRSHWDAASTLKRAERRWDEEHKQNWLQRHGFMR